MARFGALTLGNFGDELSPKVLEFATGRRVTWAPPHRAEVFAIGSILEIARQHDQAFIWGSGLRSGAVAENSLDPSRVLAVRGPLTRASLGLSTVPVGDPGLLVRSIWPSSRQQSGVVLIPHFSSFGRRADLSLIRYGQSLGWEIVAPMRPLSEVVDAIARAELVLSSSLHGIIVAQALGVPSILITFGESQEPTFKYADHYASIGQQARHVHLPTLFGSQWGHERELAQQATEETEKNIDDLVEGLTRAVASLR